MGVPNSYAGVCESEDECDFEDALRELVELKRRKDSGCVGADFERRWLLAWRAAFAICNVVGDPKL